MESKLDRMESFLDWMSNEVKRIHTITNQQFVNILEKM